LNGSVATYPVPTYRAQPVGITTGPDAKLWFAEDALSSDAKIAVFSVT
jgi:streptogramin lyase